VVLASDANTDEERTGRCRIGTWIFGDMHLGWRGEPITPEPSGTGTNGLWRATGYVNRELYSGLSRPVSTWTPGPIVDDTVIFLR